MAAYVSNRTILYHFLSIRQAVVCGPGGIRTLDLVSAIDARYQLRYKPILLFFKVFFCLLSLEIVMEGSGPVKLGKLKILWCGFDKNLKNKFKFIFKFLDIRVFFAIIMEQLGYSLVAQLAERSAVNR